MKTDQHLWDKVVMPIYKEMYKKATPKADIDKLIEDGTTKQERWFMKYYLSEEKQDEIIKKHCKGLKKLEKKKVKFEVLLGASPTDTKSSIMSKKVDK